MNYMLGPTEECLNWFIIHSPASDRSYKVCLDTVSHPVLKSSGIFHDQLYFLHRLFDIFAFVPLAL